MPPSKRLRPRVRPAVADAPAAASAVAGQQPASPCWPTEISYLHSLEDITATTQICPSTASPPPLPRPPRHAAQSLGKSWTAILDQDDDTLGLGDDDRDTIDELWEGLRPAIESAGIDLPDDDQEEEDDDQ